MADIVSAEKDPHTQGFLSLEVVVLRIARVVAFILLGALCMLVGVMCARVAHILTLKQVREALGKGAPLFPSLRAIFTQKTV